MTALSNNVIRFLESKKVSFTAFQIPAEKLGAVEVARYLGVPLDIVFKTIVVVREKAGKPILAVIPGNQEVDLKALAREVGEKKVILPTEREAERLTGLQAGGISPLALINRGFQIILDSDALRYETIHVSGGQRGLNIRLPVQALIEITGSHHARISRPPQS